VTLSGPTIMSSRRMCFWAVVGKDGSRNTLLFLRNPKNATRHALQNVIQYGAVKSMLRLMSSNISGVIGSFCLTAVPRSLLIPLSMESRCQLAVGLSRPYSKCAKRTTFKYFGIELADKRLLKYATYLKRLCG
jgi:hypothetical protein